MSTATQQKPVLINVPAGSDLSTKQFLFMDVSAGKLALAGAGTRVVGVLTNKPNASGVEGSLQIAGVAIVKAGGSITSGGGVASDANGKAIAATGSAFVCGVLMSADVSNGDDAAVLLTGASAVGLAASSETITSGALNPAVPLTNLSVTGTQAYTLADGTYVGQRKTIECTVAASTPLGTLTIATLFNSEPAVHVFHATYQRLVLEWTATGWHMVGKERAGQVAVVVGTTVLTGFDMAATYALSVTGTVHSLTTKGIPNGTRPGEVIHINTPTAASTPLGDIAITATTIATNAAATSLAAINATTCQADFRWDGATWQNTSLTTATLS